MSRIPFLLLAFGAASSAWALTPLYEEPQAERNLTPRNQVVVELGNGEQGAGNVKWPHGADRLFVEVWSEDEGEEPFNLVINGGKGVDGNLKGVHRFSVEELPPKGGGMLLGVGAGGLAKNLDLHALSNITIKTESGAACRFGVSRVFTLANGEKRPEVKSPPRRHPRDAAEHAADFAAFKAECAQGDFIIGQASAMESVRPRGGFKWRKADKVGVRLARGEYESVQILVAPNGKDLKGVTVQVEGDLKRIEGEMTGGTGGTSGTGGDVPPVANVPQVSSPVANVPQVSSPVTLVAPVPPVQPSAGEPPAPPGGAASGRAARRDAAPPNAGEPPASPGAGEPSNCQTVKPSNSFAATNVAASVVGYTETTHPPPYLMRPLKGGKLKRPPCGWWPDPILDFQKSCDVSGNDVQSFWVRVKCPRDQEAGVYEGTLVVSAEGAASVRIPFAVRVYDFEVGRVSPLPLAVSLNIPKFCDTKESRDAYCDFFADYFITVTCIYGVPTWDMLERLRDQGRLGLFNYRYLWYMGLGEKGEADFRAKTLPALRKLYDKAKELGIEKHGYFYGFDEVAPNTFSNCYLTVELLHKEFPDVPFLTTARDKLLGAEGSKLSNIDMFCIGTCAWNPTQVEKARRAGRKVWWYFSNIPASPIANTQIEGPPCEIRSLMGAQTQKFKPDGFLYYEIAAWAWSGRKPPVEPITEGPFTKWDPRSYGPWHGDGQWTCCGGPGKMPLATLRLENFRDGVEDLWYARILEDIYAKRYAQKLGDDEVVLREGGEAVPDAWCERARAALAVSDEIASSLYSFSTDPDVIYRWRDEMADLIEEAR